MTQATANAEPISAINVTPFIDVLLVLMIMIILTIPLQSHKVPIDLPAPGPTLPTTPLSHELAIERGGALIWDGRPIADSALPGLLATVAASPSTELHLRTDAETRYERFDTVLATVKRANITRLGFVGNETMRD